MKLERRALQIVVSILTLVPVLAGGAGVIMGPSLIAATSDVSMDSHFRYLSGLLLGIGFGFWSCVPNIELKTSRFQMLTLIVVIGGLARAISYITLGMPDLPMCGGLVMELVVTPLLCLWQYRISRQR